MREQGKIKWFNRVKAYGFIQPNAGGPDVMLHINLCRQLDFVPLAGMHVEFEAAELPTGLKAIWVKEKDLKCEI